MYLSIIHENSTVQNFHSHTLDANVYQTNDFSSILIDKNVFKTKGD